MTVYNILSKAMSVRSIISIMSIIAFNFHDLETAKKKLAINDTSSCDIRLVQQ